MRRTAVQSKIWYRFRELTLCPIDHRLIELSLLEKEELAWLNRYHQRVWREISPQLDSQEKRWLRSATRKLTR